MKKLMVLCGLTMVVMACSLNVKNAKIPEGYKTCSSDWQCPSDYYCGFVEVDSVAVCKPTPFEYKWRAY